ncbi:esterase-like activity of phytase family protein [Rubrivivax sp. RP6-9]|uniref:esterase-like activity of phytase family protein n=1 Tax=Rubrivivax sp. RP6-9 TaxID=3415750 RepID=UPI003CC50947
MRVDLRTGRAAALAAALCGAGAGAADESRPPLHAQVEHAVTVPAAVIDGHRPAELSALAWDADAGELLAASDRGVLFRWRLDDRGGPLHLQPVAAHAIRDAAGRSAALNAEALAWRRAGGNSAGGDDHGTLWVAGETAAQAWTLDAQGRRTGSADWPAALAADAARERSTHGVEALDWDPVHGLLAGLQRALPGPPTADGPARAWHAVHAASGRSWRFAPAGPGSQLKAIESLWRGATPGLLVLERLRGMRPVLRWLALDRCGDATPCTPEPVLLHGLPADGRHNVEGLACRDDGVCWLVSDAPSGTTPTRLLQLRLHGR